MLLGLVTLGMLMGCGTSPQFYGWPTEGGTGTPPVIEAYYAPQSTGPGSTWNIYLRAKDPEGDMLYIACMTSETGLGPVNSAEIPLKGNDRAEFSGYISMSIPVYDPFEASGLTLNTTVLIRDQRGNASQSIQLPLTLNGGTGNTIPPQWQPAANHHLGDLRVDASLFTSSGVQGGKGSF
jgi:hypothetical protein